MMMMLMMMILVLMMMMILVRPFKTGKLNEKPESKIWR